MPPKMFVRSSKFRHVFGSPAKKEHCYEGIRASKSAHDGNFCAVNPKFLAVVVESAGGGAFIVLGLDRVGRVDVNIPKVCGHRGPLTDIKWNPFNDTIIASSSEDATIKVWRVPDHGLVENLSNWIADLVGHSKKVSYIEWHPTAANVLLSAGADHMCIIWNVETESAITEILVHPDTIYSISWNHDGSAFATTCKDRKIRVIDARAGNVLAEGEGHQGSKASKVVFLGRKNRLFTTGFSRHSERQYALWDASNLSKALHSEDIDSSSGLLIPFFDCDTNVVYVAGKGDGNIRYYEVVDSAPYVFFLSQYQTSLPQRGLGVMPKRGVDTSKCEVMRFYKLHAQKEICEPVSMIVPRKSEMFQTDIYPPTASVQPAMTADQWISGINKEPLLISLKDGTLCSSSESSLSGPVAKAAVVNATVKTHGRTSAPADMSALKSSQNFKSDPTPTTFVRKDSDGVDTKLKADLSMNGFTSTSNTSSRHEFTQREPDAIEKFPHSRPMDTNLSAKLYQTNRTAEALNSHADAVSVPRDFARHDFDSVDGTQVRRHTDVMLQSKPHAKLETSVQASRATVAFSSPSAADNNMSRFVAPTDNNVSGLVNEANNMQSPTRIIVRTSSMTAGSDRTPRRLSRNVSDVSDISTTTPVTPVAKGRPRRMRANAPRDVESSSCSSTEAVNEIEDVWCDNPVYMQHHHRRRNSPSLRRLNNGGLSVQPQVPVDTSALDDVLMQTRNERPFSRSNFELNRMTAAPEILCDISSTVMTSALPSQSSRFRSEPDIAARKTISSTDVIVIGDPVVAGCGTMIDCISIEAPDNTLIKPSRLRESMRKRRTPPGSSSDDMALTAGRVSMLMQDSAGDADGTNSPFQRRGWKAASMRETRRKTTEVVMSNTFSTSASPVTQSKVALPSSADVLPAVTPSQTYQQNVVIQGTSRNSSTSNPLSSTSALSDTGSVPWKRTSSVQVNEVLPTLQRPNYLTDKTKYSGLIATNGTSVSMSETNVAEDAHLRLMRDYQELQEKYLQQQDNMRKLQEQMAEKDRTIRRLENQIRVTQAIGTNSYMV